MKDLDKLHKPVLVNEVCKFLKVSKFAHLNPKAKFIDATLGIGGHSTEFIRAGIYVLGIDNDPESLKIAEKRLSHVFPAAMGDRGHTFKLVLGNFRDIDLLARRNGFLQVEAVLMDLGISSFQLDDLSRGFSFSGLNSALDMRINTHTQAVTAADLLMALNIGGLVRMFDFVLENRKLSRKLADCVLEFRKDKKISTVNDFLSILSAANFRSRRGNAATIPFLALRVAVNSEIENLKEGLSKAFLLIKKGGRLAVISFHSGEDLVVKAFMNEIDRAGLGRIVVKKPVFASDEEVDKNIRSRSAKLRILEKV